MRNLESSWFSMSACRYNFTQLSLNNLYNTGNCYFLSLFLRLDRIHFYKQRRLPSLIYLRPVYPAVGSLTPGRGTCVLQIPHKSERCESPRYLSCTMKTNYLRDLRLKGITGTHLIITTCLELGLGLLAHSKPATEPVQLARRTNGAPHLCVGWTILKMIPGTTSPEGKVISPQAAQGEKVRKPRHYVVLLQALLERCTRHQTPSSVVLRTCRHVLSCNGWNRRVSGGTLGCI